MEVRSLNFRQLLNLAICAFGIQFVTALQMSNMSSIYKFLGAQSSNLPYLWLAAPISGLLVQPLVGQLSDSTTTRFGKRIPYIFTWGLLSAIAIFLMPFSSAVWMAALLLWMLDCSLNGCTETLRALTGDITPTRQKPTAFAMQTIFAGVGAGIAAALPWVFGKLFVMHHSNYSIPLPIKISFFLGAMVLVCTVFWTIKTTKEKPFSKKHLLQEKKRQAQKTALKKFTEFFVEIGYNIRHMPKVIRQFYVIQMFTWVGLFCMWLYFGIAIAQQVYGLPVGVSTATNAHFAGLLEQGTEWAGVCFGIYQFVSVLYAFLLPYLAGKTSPKFVHGASLVCGALGLISISLIHNANYLIISMVGIGMMWGSIMTMPYAIISAELPKSKMGVYLGIFNITITVPQIISGLFLGYVTSKIFHGYAVYTLLMGGVLIFLGGLILIYQDNLFGRLPVFTNKIQAIRDRRQKFINKLSGRPS